MYIKTVWPDNTPTRTRQKMMTLPMIYRVADIAWRKNWGEEELQTIFFMQGYGRKSLRAVIGAMFTAWRG